MSQALEVLRSMFPGDLAEEKVGWRGLNPSGPDWFSCEFCGAEHLDCTMIPHIADCPVTLARAALQQGA